MIAWQFFRRLNSPATGSEAKSWEQTFRPTSSIFLANGCKPTVPFRRLPALPSEVERKLEQLPGWGPPVGVAHNLDTQIQVDGRMLLDRFGDPSAILPTWTFLDYVWSMRRASRQKDCPPEDSGL